MLMTSKTIHRLDPPRSDKTEIPQSDQFRGN